MATQKVELEFDGTGDLLKFLQGIDAEVKGIRDEHQKTSASVQSDLKKSAEATKQFTTSLTAAATSAGAVGKAGAQGAAELIKRLVEVANASDNVERGFSDIEKQVFKDTNAALKEMARNQGIVIEGANEQKAAAIDNLVALKALTKEEGELVKETTGIIDSFKAVGIGVDAVGVSVESLRGKLQKAKDEAFAIGEKFGTGSKEFAEAAAKAGKLADEIDHINKVTDAFNPGKKLAVVTQLGEGIVGAFTAVNSLIGVISGDNEVVEKALRNAEKGVAFLIGAQSAIRGLTEANASLKAILGGLFTVQEANQAVTQATTIAQEENAVALEASAAAEAENAAAMVAREGAVSASIAATEAKVVAEGENAAATEAGVAAEVEQAAATQANTVAKVENTAATEANAIAAGEAAVAQEAGAIATAENVVATEADVVAKGAQSTANIAAAGTTGILTGAMEALTAAVLANPILALVAVLVAVGVAMIAMSDDTEEASKSFEKLNDDLDETIKLRDKLRDQASRLADLDAEAEAIRNAGNAEKERAAIEQKGIRETQRIEAELDEQRLKAAIDRNKLLRLFFELAEAGRNRDVGESARVVKEIAEVSKKLEATNEVLIQLDNDKKAAIKGNENDLARFDADKKKERIDRAKNTAKEELAIREQLATDIEALQKRLADKIASLETEQADPGQRLERIREADEAELKELELKLRREVALTEIATEKLIGLSEKQKEALADQQISAGGGQLGPEQQAQLLTLQYLNQKKYFDAVAKLQDENAKTLLSIQKDSAEKQRAQLELDLVARAAELKKAGATDAQILEDAARHRLDLERSIAQKTLDLQEQTQIDLIEARQKQGVQNAETERAAQVAILEVKIEFAEKALALIEDDGTAESKAHIAAAQKTIAGLKAELNKVLSTVTPINIFDLLGIELSDEDQQRVLDATKQITGAFLDMQKANNEARQAELDAQIENTNAIIDDLHRRGDELQAQLEKDQKANAEGLANNLNATLAAIEENKKAEQAALAEKKRIQAEQKKLAREQVFLDSASQASSIAVSSANLIKTWSSLPFGVGLISAFAQIAQIVAFFTSLRSKLAAAAAPQGLKEGTKSVKRKAGEAPGIDTVHTMLTEGEAVVPVAKNKRHAAVVAAMIDDDYTKLSAKDLEPFLAHIDLSPLLAGTGVSVNEESVGKVVRMNEQRVTRERAGADMAGVEKRLDALTAEVKAFKKQDRDRPTATELPSGAIVLTEGPHFKRIVRPD